MAFEPGLEGPSATDDADSGRATVDGRGLRVTPGLPEDPRTRILTVGDSFTFGWGVSDHETWPAQLQSLLNKAAPGRFGVTNVGFPGCTSYQARQAFDGWIQEHQPNLVVFLLGRNDGRRALSPDRQAHRVQRWKPSVADYVFPFMFLSYQNLQGWYKWRQASPVERVDSEHFQKNLGWLVQRAQQQDIEVILLQHWPPKSRPTRDLARRLEVPWVNSPRLLQRAQKEQKAELFIKAHHHPNGRGYAVLAAEVTQLIPGGR